MIYLNKDEMSHLPVEVKSLVRDGVYSLYTLRQYPDIYVLHLSPSEELYFLDSKGYVVSNPGYEDLVDIPIMDAVTFEDDGYLTSLRINA